MRLATTGRVSRRTLATAAAVLLPIALAAVSGGYVVGATDVLLVIMLALTLSVITFVYPSPVSFISRAFILTGLIAGILLVQHFMPSLTGPDANLYWYNTTHLSLAQLLQELSEQFSLSPSGLFAATFLFPAIIKTFLGKAVEYSPDAVAFLNSIFLVISAHTWCDLVRRKYSTDVEQSSKFYKYTFAFFLLSPSLVYWSSAYNKDVITLAATVLCAAAIYDKKVIAAIVWLTVATLLRPYAVIIVLTYLLFLYPLRIRSRLACCGLAATVVFAATGFSYAAVANMPVATLYVFMSPNPFDTANWALWFDNGRWAFSPLFFTFESVFYGMMLALGSCLFILRPRSRGAFSSIIGSIFLGVGSLVYIGFLRTGSLGGNYEFLHLGETFLRKKLMVMPLIITWAALALSQTGSARKILEAKSHASIGRESQRLIR